MAMVVSTKRKKVLKTWSKHNVPDDLWPEILSRLPVKSLLRFRSVSISWKAVIDDPDFARLHLTRFSNNCLQSHLFVVQGTYLKPQCAVRCSKTLRATFSLGYFETDIPASIVVGSIDGLFMLQNWMSEDTPELVLWNPSIRKTRVVPPIAGFPFESKNIEFGLGFDPLIGDYKHVTFVVMHGSGLRFIAVYTVGTNSWKTIEFQEEEDKGSSWRELCTFDHQQKTFCLSGVLYALAKDQYVTRFKLVSFNLSNEVFASIELPEDPESSLYSRALTLMDGGCSLALVNLSSPNGSIWVLDGLGGDSWTLRYTFDTEIPKYDRFAWTSSFLYLKEDGDDTMLLKWKNMVISYNLETKDDEIVLKKNIHVGNTCPYIESLLLH